MKRYLYDAETKHFTGMVDSDETLENSTEISPFDDDGQAKIIDCRVATFCDKFINNF